MRERIESPNQETQPALPVMSAPAVESLGSTLSQLAYHEMAEVPVREVDLFEQLEKNLEQLSMVRSRMQFMMREIRYLMKL